MTIKLTFLLFFSQVVYTDQFTPQWFPVEAPRHALKFDGRQFASQDAPRQAGDWEISYGHYDKFGRIGTLSPISLITTTCDNFEYGISFAGTERLNQATGAQVFERRAGTPSWTPCATEASVPWVIKPGSTFADGDDWLFSMFHRASPTPHERFNNVQTNFWQTSQENRPSRAPSVRVFALRNEGYDIAYSNVCCNGETGLSAITVANPDPSKREIHHNRIRLRRADRYYPGVIGYFLYMRRIGETQWHRQPTPYADVGPFKYNRPTEEYLWPATADRIQVLNFHPTGISPAPVTMPQSYANELQVALWNSAAATVIVRGEKKLWNNDLKKYVEDKNGFVVQPLCCPIHLEYFGNWNQNKPGLGEAPKHNRTITTEYGGTVELTTTRDCPGGTKTPSLYWEALIIESQFSKLTGLRIKHDGGRAGLAAHDWSGGQAFGPTLTNCEFYITNAAYPSWGLWQHVCNTGKTEDGNHSLSELKAVNCKFIGTTAIKIAGIQSVNFEMVDVSLGSDPRANPAQSCGLYQATGSRTSFRNSLKYGGGRTFYSNGFRSSISIEGLWIDEDVATLCEGRTYSQGSVSIKGNKVNHFGNTDFNLLSLPCGGVDQMEVSCEGLDSQINKPDLESVIFSQSYGRALFSGNRSRGLFAEKVSIRTPTLDQWKQWGYFNNWDNGADITLRKSGVTYGRDTGAEVLQVKPKPIVIP